MAKKAQGTINTETKTRKFVSMPGRKMLTALTEKNGKRYTVSRDRFFTSDAFANELHDNGFHVLEIREGWLKADAFDTNAEIFYGWISEEEALWGAGEENLDFKKIVEFYGDVFTLANKVFWGIKEI